VTVEREVPHLHGREVDVGAEAAFEAAYRRRLGRRLRAVRRAQGLRLHDVEERSGGRFKAVVVGSYERGDRAVAMHRLAALAEFYGVPVLDLLPDDESWTHADPWTSVVRLDVPAVHVATDHDLQPLQQVVRHVRVLRGDLHGQVLTLRGDDLRTVAYALGLEVEDLPRWLDGRGLLARR
jgi:transcriptional regulator with XRE-family HTH domain